MAVGDLYYLTVQIRTGGNVTQIGMGYEMTVGSMDADTLESACLRWQQDWLPDLLRMLSDIVNVERIEMVPVTDLSEVPGILDQTLAIGTIVGEALPSNMACVFSLPTDAPNSKHNGRLFVSGVAHAGTANGVLTAAQQILNDDFALRLNDTIVTFAPQDAQFKSVVISRFVDGVKRVPPVAFTISDAIARPNVRQQRRRKTRSFGFVG